MTKEVVSAVLTLSTPVGLFRRMTGSISSSVWRLRGPKGTDWLNHNRLGPKGAEGAEGDRLA